jgi:hypothetical protein
MSRENTMHKKHSFAVPAMLAGLLAALRLVRRQPAAAAPRWRNPMLNKLIAAQVVGWSVLAAAPAHAAQTPGLEYSDVTLTIESHCTGCPARATKTVPVGDATPLEHLTTFPGYGPFVITQSTQPSAFVSTSASGSGVVRVGVSGVIGEPERSAEAVYEQTIRNLGSTDSHEQKVHIVIPEILVLTSFSEGAGNLPFSGVWRAEASIEIFWTKKDKDGFVLVPDPAKFENDNPLALNVTVDRTNGRSSPASITTTLSNDLDLLARGVFPEVGGQIHDVLYVNQVPGTYDYDAIGHIFDPIEADVFLTKVPAGGSLEVAYAMRVSYTIDEALVDDRVSAFEVTIGDPFEIGGSGGSFSVGEVAVVPEPGSLALMAFGGMLLLAWRRRPRGDGSIASMDR